MRRAEQEYEMSLRGGFLQADRGGQIYEELRERLERDHMYKFVQINIDTGSFVIAETEQEAARQFDAKFGADVSAFVEHIGRRLVV